MRTALTLGLAIAVLALPLSAAQASHRAARVHPIKPAHGFKPLKPFKPARSWKPVKPAKLF